MAVKLKLAGQLHGTNLKLGAELAAKRRAQIEEHQKAEKETIERQIRLVPIIADQLIKGLPDFLQKVADAEYSHAYVVYRGGCEPWERDFPNYTSEHIPESHRSRLTEYMVRRYMKGTIQRIALWGLKQGFRVGLGHIDDSRDIEFWAKHHHGVFPVYMPGMFRNYIPTGYSNNLLFFAW